MPPQRERFTLTIEAQPDEVPVIIRLRHILKRLLRTFGFRCVEIVPTPEDDQGKDAVPD